MAIRSLGLVTVPTAGTPVRLTANESDPTAHVGAHSVSAQASHTNAARVYVGDRQSMVRATRVGVLMVLAIPTANALSQFTATIVNAPAGFNAAQLWLDVDNDGEGAVVSILEA